MKHICVAAVFATCMLLPWEALAKEITLINSKGEAIAYIDTEDDLTIYLWKGKPVAYIDDGSLWGFNGKHLGWFEKGIVWDHKGYAAGAIPSAVSVIAKVEPIKGIKQISPIKSIQEIAAIQPIHKNKWSATPLSLFLARGR